MKALLLLSAALVLMASSTHQAKAEATVHLHIQPEVTRSIEGHSALERHRYFAIADSGKGFEEKATDNYRTLVDELDISFGRNLGPINGAVKYSRAVREDPNRPGHLDLDFFQQQIAKGKQHSQTKLAADFSPNLHVAAHGSPGASPDFMGEWMTETVAKEKSNKHPKVIPANHEAAAELAAAVFQHHYTDLTRPRYFEPINEPHWSFLIDPEQIAHWHIATRKAIQAATPEVLIGGPCNSVGYFFRNNYQAFNGVKAFIEATAGQLDFYSFHTYDYYNWNGEQFEGAILSGPPLDSVLDLVPNYTNQVQGTPSPIVISEQGGYAKGDVGDSNHDLIMKAAKGRVIPKENESDFAYALRARSMHDFIHLNSIISNTVTYMEHPHTVLKAVPFILHNAAAWDPHYYAVLYAPENFEKGGKLVPTGLQNFYRLFAGVSGRRVKSTSSDPDIACRSFAKDNQVFIVAHNFSEKSEVLSLNLPQPEKLTLRRLGRNKDLTLNYTEEPSTLQDLTLAPLETLVFIADYPAPITEKTHLNETIHYGDKTMVNSGEKIAINLPNLEEVTEGTLRIGFTTPHDSNKSLTVKLNDHLLPDLIEDSSSRTSTEKAGYATTRSYPLDPKHLQENNLVEVTLSDPTQGKIGTAIIRTARPVKTP